jgi:hypothetical protein
VITEDRWRDARRRLAHARARLQRARTWPRRPVANAVRCVRQTRHRRSPRRSTRLSAVASAGDGPAAPAGPPGSICPRDAAWIVGATRPPHVSAAQFRACGDGALLAAASIRPRPRAGGQQ